MEFDGISQYTYSNYSNIFRELQNIEYTIVDLYLYFDWFEYLELKKFNKNCDPMIFNIHYTRVN